MKSILVAIVSAAALVLTAACGSSDTEADPTIDASAGTAVVQIPTATSSGFTNEQLRSPEFRDCIDKLYVYALGATSHTHIYRDRDTYGLERHSHSVSYREEFGGGKFEVSSSGGGGFGFGPPAGDDIERETANAGYRLADARGPIKAACSSLLTSGDLSGN